MNTHKKESNADLHASIQQNVIRVALMVFFVATVSAAGGFLQGEKIAQSGADNLAAAFSIETKGGNPTGRILIDGDPATTFTRNGSNYSGVADGKPFNLTCSNGNCTGTFNGEPISAQEDALKKAHDAKDAGANKEDAEKCLKGEGEECRNKCTTTYVSVKSGKPSPVDCYGKGGDLAQQELKKLEQCIGQAGPGKPKVPETFLKQQLCLTKSEVTVEKDGSVKLEDKSLGTSVPITIPAKCKAHVENINKIRKGEGAQAKATGADASACKWKGAATCFPKGMLTGTTTGGAASTSGEFECKKKIDGAKDVSSKPTPTQTFNDCIKAANGDANKIRACAQQLVANNNQPSSSPFSNTPGLPSVPMLPMTPMMPGSNKGSGNNNNNNSQCPTGYELTTQDGRKVCKKKSDENKKPACLIIASKEKINNGETVTLRWRTANAESLTISNLDDSSLNGQKSVTPTETTTYELVAKGAGESNTKTCNVTVTVDGDGTSGPTGSAPPRIACNPTTVEKGKTAQVKWQCTNAASKTEGTNVDTDGKLADTATVRPEHNTEYAVACLNDEGTELGKDSCAVTVGEPKYDIIVHPEVAGRGDRVRVSWASLFMKSCRVQGPRAFGYDRTQGVVITEPFSLDQDTVPNSNIRAAIYSIECESDFGGVFSKDVTVRFEE